MFGSKGRTTPATAARITITTTSSINVKARRAGKRERDGDGLFTGLSP
jgi:hypothetical protein